jgi:uncharacterized protein
LTTPWLRARGRYAFGLRSRASTAVTATSAVAVFCAALAAYATQWEPYHPKLRTRVIRVPPNWPALNVLHVSDLHLRESDRRLLQAQREILSRVSPAPDLVCATGDLCEEFADVGLVIDVLREVRPRLGTFAVLGNHEYDAPPPPALQLGWGGLLWRAFKLVFRRAHSRGAGDADRIATALADSGISVLRNSGVRLAVGQDPLWVAGSDSVWAGRADLDAAMRGRNPLEGALALIHEPEAAFAAVSNGADLVLAGHTHGGQVRLPGVGPLYYHRADDRLRGAAGIQKIDGIPLHITAGLGQLLPLRLLCPPEAVWLRCMPAATG